MGVFVKQEITQSTTIHKIGEDNLEIIWIRICLRKKKELYIGVYYGKQETRMAKEEVINEVIDIASQIKKIQEKSDNILLVGDFNAKLFDGRSRNGRIIDKELIQPLNLTILNRSEKCIGKCTRKNTSNDTERSEIDYAITTENMWHSVRKMVIDEEEEFKLKGKKPSDLNTIIIELELQADQKRRENKLRKLKINNKTPWEEFRRKARELDIKECNYEIAMKSLNKIIDNTIGWIDYKPKKTIRNKEIQTVRNQRRKSKIRYEKAINGKNEEEIRNTLREYKHWQEQVKNEIVKEDHRRMENIISRMTRDNPEDRYLLWKIKRIINRENKDEFTETKDSNGNRIKEPSQIKERYAEYYENLYKTRAIEERNKEWCNHVDLMILGYEKSNKFENNMMNKPINMNEITTAIKQLKKRKACGPDGIPNEVLIFGGHGIHRILLEMFNTIFETENIPSQWKEAEIISLYKGKGDREKMEFRRGITLASNIEKLFERVINNRLVKDLEFTEGQAGGRKNRSTTDQLFILKSVIQKAKIEKKKLYIIYIDIEKAYDKAWLDGIMYILWNKGIKGKIWRIIRKLNKDLKAKCRTRVGLSREIKINGNLRQGGVLSVTLFAKLMDALSERLIEDGRGTWYGGHLFPSLLLVDDVAILADSESDMERQLITVEDFMIKNRLSLSQKKTKIMIVNATKEDEMKEWKIGDTKVEQTKNYTYLGEVIECNGPIDTHLNSKVNKVKAMTSNILNITKDRTLQKIKTTTMLDLHDKCIVPTILYGCETWTINKKQMEAIENMQL